MNSRAKRCMKELEALGFRRDYDAKVKGIAYRHPNQPDQIVKVYDLMPDSTYTMVIRLANKIAETGYSGPRMPSTIKERARISKLQTKARKEREIAEAKARAEKAEAEHTERERLAEQEAREREIRRLMNPGFGH